MPEVYRKQQSAVSFQQKRFAKADGLIAER
jgi:hypothetical protein